MSEEEIAKEGTNGTIRVENGAVIIEDPKEGGTYCTILPGENVEVFVDMIKAENMVEVSSKNEVLLIPKVIPPKQDVNIRIDKEKMHAYMAVSVVLGKKYIINDSDPVTALTVNAHECVETMPDTLTLEEAVTALGDKGVKFGIDEQALLEAIALADGKERLVAEGIYPEQGKDAYIIDVYANKDRLNQGKSDRLWVDNLDYGTVVSVDAGTVVARKVPLEPGKPGMNVLGVEVLPPKPRDVELKAGKGVEIRSNGLEAVATVSGRPQVKGSLVSVSPVYTVEGDVDVNTGNIYFKGDVVVKGSVTDGMKIKAVGSVVVKGFAAHCQIEAGGDILIQRNLVGGNVRSGSNKVSLYPIRDILGSLSKKIKDLVNAVHLLSADNRFKSRPEVKKYGIGVIMKILLDTKFHPVGRQYRELLDKIQEMGDEAGLIFNNEILGVFNETGDKLIGRGPLKLKSIGEIDRLLENFQASCSQALVEIEHALDYKSSITAGYVQHSILKATGDIVITGRGAYNAKIFSGGNVIVKDKKGFLRGGEIVAEGDIEVYELGSVGGAITAVSVPEGREIKSVVIHSGVKLKVGTSVKKVQRLGDVMNEE